jgi:hypothetical protein
MPFTPLHDRVLVRRIEGDETTKGVVSDEFELVSARTVKLPLMPRRDHATRRERRRGWP